MGWGNSYIGNKPQDNPTKVVLAWVNRKQPIVLQSGHGWWCRMRDEPLMRCFDIVGVAPNYFGICSLDRSVI